MFDVGIHDCTHEKGPNGNSFLKTEQCHQKKLSLAMQMDGVICQRSFYFYYCVILLSS